MDNKMKRKNPVAFNRETESTVFSISELVMSDGGETNPPSTNISITKISGGDTGSNSSVSMGVLDDDPKYFKQKILQLEHKCKLLEMETEKAFAELYNEKRKNERLEKKLKFVKDNQEVFMRLKEAYVNMKYNEAAGRKMIEIREKGIQTWGGILCRGCIETEEIRQETESIKERYINSFVISTENMQQLITTIKYLRDIIDRREKSWSLNIDRESKLLGHLDSLTMENNILKDIIKSSDEIKIAPGSPIQPHDHTETTDLKKIIVKYEKRFRDMTEKDCNIISSPLNEKEQKFVEKIMSKYLWRLREKSKSHEKIRSRSVSVEKKFSRHSSEDCSIKHTLQKLNSRAMPRSEQKSEYEKSQRTENAILLMDSLFDSDTN